LSYIIHTFMPRLLVLGPKENFDHIVMFLIPIILMYDALHFKWSYIKTYKKSLFYLAIVSVSLSIFLGAMLYQYKVFGVGISLAGYITLYSMNMATDAISVGKIFKSFKNIIPDNIKILVEGESLGNDATAVIAFYFIGLPWLLKGNFDLSMIPIIAFKVYFLSIAIGLLVSTISFHILTLFDVQKQELLIFLGTSYFAFILGELFEVSGILSLIVAIISLKYYIEKLLNIEKGESKTNEFLFKYLKKKVTTITNQKNIQNSLEVFSFLGAILIFVVFSYLIDIDKLLLYKKEILILFLTTTFIRMFVMFIFYIIGKTTSFFPNIKSMGYTLLVLAGIKGNLSIIMLHSLPVDYEYYNMFEQLTIGNILLSTYVYGLLLVGYMIYQSRKKNLLQ